jgi:hypothetical protein
MYNAPVTCVVTIHGVAHVAVVYTGLGARRVGALVTAGSPLRRYTTMLSWGSEIGNLRLVPTWVNFFDRHDPVRTSWIVRPCSARWTPRRGSPGGQRSRTARWTT